MPLLGDLAAEIKRRAEEAQRKADALARQQAQREGGRGGSGSGTNVGRVGARKRPDGRRSREARNGHHTTALTAEEKAAVTTANRVQAEKDFARLHRLQMAKVTRRAGVISKRLEGRLSRIETRRQSALAAATVAQARLNAAVAARDIEGAREATLALQRANYRVLDTEHEEATAYGLDRRAKSMDILESRNKVWQATRAYTGKALGEPVPIGEMPVSSPREAYGYENKVREEYQVRSRTKSGDVGHGKTIARAYTIDVAMMRQHPEWWDTEEGREASAAIFVAHNDEIRAHSEAVNLAVDPYLRKQKRIYKGWKEAKTQGEKNRWAKKYVALKNDKRYAQLTTEQRVMYGNEAVNKKGKVRPGSDMGVYWLYDVGAQYVLESVEQRQQQMLALGTNAQPKLDFKKTLADLQGNVADLLAGAKQPVVDAGTGVEREETTEEVIARMESQGMPAEQQAAIKQGFTEGDSAQQRAIETAEDPVLSYVYKYLLGDGIETREDVQWKKEHVQIELMPKMLADALAMWKTSEEFLRPSRDIIYEEGRYQTLPDGTRTFMRSDGSIRTRENWLPLQLTKYGYEKEPLWDACVFGGIGVACGWNDSFGGKRAEVDGMYLRKGEDRIRGEISSELSLEFRDSLAGGLVGTVVAAPMALFSAFVMEAEGYMGAKVGVAIGNDASVFDTKDYEQLAHDAVNEWRAKPEYYDPGQRYGLFKPENYGADEEGAYFLYTPVAEEPLREGFEVGVTYKMRRGQHLPVQVNTYWSPNGFVDPFFAEPGAEMVGALGNPFGFDPHIETVQQYEARIQQLPIDAVMLDQLRLDHEYSYEDKYYRAALTMLRPDDPMARLYAEDSEWTNVEELPLSHAAFSDDTHPLWAFIGNPLVTILGGKVVRAVSKEDGRVRESISFGFDFAGNRYEPLPIHIGVDGGDYIKDEIAMEGAQFKGAMVSGHYDIAVEIANDLGKVWHFGNLSEFGNFVNELVFDITNFIPGVQIVKRSVNAVREGIAFGRVAEGSKVGKFFSGVGEGLSKFATHPDTVRIHGAIAKDMAKTFGMNQTEVVRWLRNDLLGIVGDVDSVEGWRAAIDRVAAALVGSPNANISAPQLHHWVEENLLAALKTRGVVVNGQLEQAIEASAKAKAKTAAKNVREQTLGADINRRTREANEEFDTMAKQRHAEERTRAQMEAQKILDQQPKPVVRPRSAQAGPVPKAREYGVKTPPPAAATPAPTKLRPRSAVHAGRELPKQQPFVPGAVQARSNPTKMAPTTTGAPRMTGRGMKRGQKRPMEAKDVVARIDKLMAEATRIKREAQGLPTGIKRYNLVRKFRKAEREVDRLKAQHAALERVVRELNTIDMESKQIFEYAKAEVAAGRAVNTTVTQKMLNERTLAVVARAGYADVPDARALIRNAERETKAALDRHIADQEAAADLLYGPKFDTIPFGALTRIREIRAEVQAELMWAEAALPISGPKLLYEQVGRTADDLNAFLDKNWEAVLRHPPTPRRVSYFTSVQQAEGAAPYGVRAPAALPADIQALYLPQGPAGSLDDALRAEEGAAQGLWRAGQTEGRAGMFTNEWTGGPALDFPRLVEPPGGIAQTPELGRLDVVMNGNDAERAMAAFEAKVRIFEHQWNVFLATADRRLYGTGYAHYPTDYPHWLAGGYADARKLDALREQNNAIVAVLSARRMGRETDEVYLVVDRVGRVRPELRRVRESDVPYGPEEMTRQEWLAQEAAERAPGRARESMKQRKEGMEAARGMDPEPSDFDVYEIGDELKVYTEDRMVGGEYYQPHSPFDSADFGKEFQATKGAVYRHLNVKATKPGEISKMDEEGLVRFLHQIEHAARREFGRGKGALTYRRQTQALFDLFHNLHIAAVLNGDMEAWETLSRLHDIQSRRLLSGELDRYDEAFVVTYLMMESRTGLPFSYASDFMAGRFRDAAVARGMMPDRALQMIQHRYHGVPMMTPRELNPSLTPIFDQTAGVKRADGTKEGWGPTEMPETLIPDGEMPIPLVGKKGVTKPKFWTHFFHYSAATESDRTVVSMVRRAITLLNTNTAREGSWQSSWGRAAKQSKLRPAALERGVHGLVVNTTEKVGDRWVVKSKEAHQQMGALYVNYNRYRGLMPTGTTAYSPARNLYEVNAALAKKLGKTPDVSGEVWVTYDELVSLGAHKGFKRYEDFVHDLGKVREQHALDGAFERTKRNPSAGPVWHDDIFDAKGVPTGQHYHEYGDAVGGDDGIRVAWEMGTTGASGYSPIAATTPFEAVFHFLVHRGYWSDGNWHSAGVARAEVFLEEMERFADTLKRPELLVEAKKLVLDMNEPAFAALRRRAVEQAGILTPWNESFVRLELMRQLGIATQWVEKPVKNGPWVRMSARGNPVGRLYMKVNERTVQQEVDRIIGEMRRQQAQLKDDIWERSATTADEAEYERLALGRQEKYPEAYADMAPAVARLEHQWDLLSKRGDTVTTKQKREVPLHSRKKVDAHMVEWEAADPKNKRPVRPSARLKESVKHYDEVVLPRWEAKYAQERAAFAGLTKTVEAGPSIALQNFVGDLVNILKSETMTAEDWKALDRLVINVKTGLTAHRGLQETIITAVRGRDIALEHSVAAARDVSPHMSRKAADFDPAKDFDPAADISGEKVPVVLGHQEIAEVEAYLDPAQGGGPHRMDEDAAWLDQWEDGIYDEANVRQQREIARQESATGNINSKNWPKTQLEQRRIQTKRRLDLAYQYMEEHARRLDVDAESSLRYDELVDEVQARGLTRTTDPYTGEPVTAGTPADLVRELKARKEVIDTEGGPMRWGVDPEPPFASAGQSPPSAAGRSVVGADEVPAGVDVDVLSAVRAAQTDPGLVDDIDKGIELLRHLRLLEDRFPGVFRVVVRARPSGKGFDVQLHTLRPLASDQHDLIFGTTREFGTARRAKGRKADYDARKDAISLMVDVPGHAVTDAAGITTLPPAFDFDELQAIADDPTQLRAPGAAVPSPARPVAGRGEYAPEVTGQYAALIKRVQGGDMSPVVDPVSGKPISGLTARHVVMELKRRRRVVDGNRAADWDGLAQPVAAPAAPRAAGMAEGSTKPSAVPEKPTREDVIAVFQKKHPLPIGRDAKPGEGWKLHLAVDPEDYDYVNGVLTNLAGKRYKNLHGGSHEDGKDFTVYVGSRDDAMTVARYLDNEHGLFFREPPGPDAGVLDDDVVFAGNIRGRFENTLARLEGGERFHQYGGGGIPYFERDMMLGAFGGDRSRFIKPDVLGRAHNELAQRYGEFYTGSDAFVPVGANLAPPPAPGPEWADPFASLLPSHTPIASTGPSLTPAGTAVPPFEATWKMTQPEPEWVPGPYDKVTAQSGVFAQVDGPASGPQTYKLHISATPEEAARTLGVVAEIMEEMGVSFKWVKKLSELSDPEGFGLGAVQQGKFITIYAPDDLWAEVIRRVGEGLSSRGLGKNALVVPGEPRAVVGTPMFYRREGAEFRHVEGGGVGGGPPGEEPPPMTAPPPPDDPDAYLDGSQATDGMVSEARQTQEAGRTIWQTLGGENGTEVGYYYAQLRDIQRELRRKGISSEEVIRLRGRRDSLTMAIRSVRRDMGRGKPRRRTTKEAYQAAETVRQQVEGVVPSNRMAYHATTAEGMVTEHARSIWVRAAKAIKHGRVMGEGLPAHVMAAFDPAHWRGLNEAVTKAVRAEQPHRGASLEGTFLPGQSNVPDPDDFVKTHIDKDPQTREAVQRAINKYCADNNIPVWNIHLYWRVRTFMEGSAGRMRRGIGMLDEVGGDMDAFQNLRHAAADEEAMHQIRWMLMDHPEMTPEEAAELLTLRFQSSGTVIPRSESISESDITILHGMFQHLTGVTDVNDGDAVRNALQANGTRPPWEGGKFSTRQHLEMIGKWAPRTLDEVGLNGAWSLEAEREYWHLNYGEAPAWVDDPRIHNKQIFRSRDEYLGFQREVGGYDDAAQVERALRAGKSHIRLEDFAHGENGMSRTRDWAMERKWAMERYGDLVHTNGEFHAMPWLMTPQELVNYRSAVSGPIEGLISHPDEIRSVEHAIQELVGKYVGYYEALVDATPGQAVGIDSADVHMLTFFMVQQLASTTPWRKGLKRMSRRKFLDVWSAFWTGSTLMHPAFTVSNVVDTPSKAILFGWSEKYARRQVSERTMRNVPNLESLGQGERSAMFYSTGARAPLERLRRPYGGYRSVEGIGDAVGGFWDGMTTGLARRVLPEVEYKAKLRLGQQLYEGMYDEVANVMLTKYGVTDEAVVDLMVKRRVSERLNALFPSLDNAGMAERMLNRLLPFTSYYFKNTVLWTGWVLDHPWTIMILQKAQYEMARHNNAQWLHDHPGWTGPLPENLAHQILLPDGSFLDLGMFTDGSRGARWITGEGVQNFIGDAKGIEAMVKEFVRPLPSQEGLFSSLLYDITGYGGRYVTRQIVDERGVPMTTGGPNNDGTFRDYVGPATKWNDQRFDYVNDLLPMNGLREVIGDLMREGSIDGQGAGRILAATLTFSEFGHPSETRMLEWQYYVLADRDKAIREAGGVDPGSARKWLETVNGQRLKELWAQQRVDPNDPGKPVFDHFSMNEYVNVFYDVDTEGNLVFKAPDPDAARKLWRSRFMPEPDEELSEAQQDLQEVYDQFDALITQVSPYDQEGREELWKLRRAAEGAVFAAHPMYLEYYAFGTSRAEYEAKMAKSQIDFERNQFFTMYDWDAAPEAEKARKQWEKDRVRYLEEHPEFAATLADEASSYQAAVNAANRRMSAAIDLSEGYERVRDWAYNHGQQDVAAAVSELQDRNAIAFGMEAMGYDADGNFKYKADSVWTKVLRGKDPVAAWYPNLMKQAGQQARGAKGEFDVGKWWRIVNRNPALRKEHMARQGMTAGEWERDGQYYSFWERQGKLADKGKWDQYNEAWENAPAWVKERYEAGNPKAFKKTQQNVAYGSYMGRWIGMMEKGNRAAGMRYFNSLPGWVKERYYEGHQGQSMRPAQWAAYSGILDRMFAFADKDDWDSARKVWDSAPAWVKSWYVAHNGKTPFEGGGGGSGKGISDPQFRQYMGFMKTWVGFMKQGDQGKADRYFRSLPDWAKDFYLRRNPDKAILELDNRLYGMAQDYFIADKEEQKAMLARNPALARWLNDHDSNKARFDAISYIYSQLPPDPWLRRVYREKYPEIFSAEAEGKRTRQAIFAILEKHPDLAKGWMDSYRSIAADAQEALQWAEPRPDQPVLDRASLRMPSRGRSAEEVALQDGDLPLRTPVGREKREPLAV